METNCINVKSRLELGLSGRAACLGVLSCFADFRCSFFHFYHAAHSEAVLSGILIKEHSVSSTVTPCLSK